MIDVDEIRSDFPILETKINGNRIAYLDSAATSQKPRQVIDTVLEFYSSKNSNVGRSLYKIAEQATLEFEQVREKARKFINARDAAEIIFTCNTTLGVNTVMRGWGERNIKKGDKIVTSILEHHSNFVPWLELAKRKKAKLEIMDIDENGELKEGELEKIKGAKLVAVTGASNVAGTMPDIKKICRIARDTGAVTLIDAAQLVPGTKTDVSAIGCDFMVFSGHKMLAPFGSGVLYGKKEVIEQMDPFLYGSEMIKKVYADKATWNDAPHKFEAGTPNVAETMGLGMAMDYLGRVGMDNVRAHEEKLVSYLLKRMKEVKGLRIIGPQDHRKRAGLVAFELDKVHPHDVAAMLDEEAICIRSGHHCAMPLHDRLGIPASSRASVYLYNTTEEIDRLIDGLEKIKKVFGG